METMGQVFKSARERKRISLATAAAKTRIKIQHLEMMERDDFSRMPAPAYARGFIRMYADFLNLESGPLIEEYNALHAPGARGRPAPAPKPVPAQTPESDDEPEPSEPPPPRAPKPARSPIGPKLAAAVLGVLTPANLRRAGIALAVLALLALLALGARRCVREVGSSAPPGAPRRGAPALVEEPSDTYLPIPAQPGAAP